MAVIEAYFDESYGDGLLCVAGYVFTKGACRKFDRAWRGMLGRRDRNLPYFRMSACAHHNDPFDKLSKAECDLVAREAIALIKDYAEIGIAETIDELDYEAKAASLSDRLSIIPTGYDLCFLNCINAVAAWAKARGPKGKIAYFFEAGHKHQQRTNYIMTEMFKHPLMREHHRYLSHSFVDKVASRPCQAADLLAWQWFTERKKLARGEPTRKDLASLLEIPHMADHTTGQLALDIMNLEYQGLDTWDDIDPLAEPIVLAVPRLGRGI